MQLIANVIPGQTRIYPPSRLIRYATTCVLVALALLITLSLPAIRYGTPFLFFFLAVIVSAVVGGIGPGLLALTLATGVVELWVRADGSVDGSVLPFDRWQPVQTAAYVVVMGTIILLIEALRRSQARLNVVINGLITSEFDALCHRHREVAIKS